MWRVIRFNIDLMHYIEIFKIFPQVRRKTLEKTIRNYKDINKCLYEKASNIRNEMISIEKIILNNDGLREGINNIMNNRQSEQPLYELIEIEKRYIKFNTMYCLLNLSYKKLVELLDTSFEYVKDEKPLGLYQQILNLNELLVNL
jgi:hypothetical protein